MKKNRSTDSCLGDRRSGICHLRSDFDTIRFENVKKAKERGRYRAHQGHSYRRTCVQVQIPAFYGRFRYADQFRSQRFDRGATPYRRRGRLGGHGTAEKSRQEKYRNLHGSRYRHDLRTEEAFARSGEEFPLHTGNEQAGRIHDRSRHGYDRVEGRRSGRRGQGPLREVPRYGYVPSGSDQPHQGSEVVAYDKYPGIKFGSMEGANNEAGNWGNSATPSKRCPSGFGRVDILSERAGRVCGCRPRRMFGTDAQNAVGTGRGLRTGIGSELPCAGGARLCGDGGVRYTAIRNGNRSP